MSRVERVADDILVLTDLVPIDGRVSWIPPNAKGVEPYNAYVVLSDDRALLIDTGVALHEESLLGTLRNVIGSRQLVVWITRIELDNLGNLARIIEDFPGVQVITGNVVPLFKLVHISETIAPPLPARRILIGNNLAEFGFARLRIYEALIRTLGSTWLWDDKTRTLFTTDIFCTDMMERADQSVLRRDEVGFQTAEQMREFILRKFDWLAPADTTPLRNAWTRFFSEIRPAVIAPIRGRVQVGEEIAARAIETYGRAAFSVQMAESASGAVR